MTQDAFAKALPDELQALSERHLPLVRMLSGRFANHGIDREDLFQQGCIGLMKAVRGYDASYGVAFSTYAVPLILGEMRMLCRSNSAIHIPRTIRERKSRLHQTQSALTQQLGREPTVSELSHALSIEPAELTLLMEEVTVSSLDASRTEDGGTLADTLADETNPWLDRLMFYDLLARLPRDDQTLLKLRYRNGLSQTEVAKRLGVHQSYVSRHETALMGKLKKLWNDESCESP